MPRSNKFEETSFAEMFAANAEVAPPRRRFRAFAAYLAAPLVVGASLFALVSPLAIGAGALVVQGSNSWDALPAALPDEPLASHTVLLDRDGTEFARFFAEDRTPVKLKDVNASMPAALLAIEDTRFYEHGAIDPKGFARAAGKTLTGTRQGGSTLTQQLVENRLLAAAGDDPEKIAAARAQSVMGKIQETRYAVELEKTLSKDEILEEYLNTVYFGNGAYGIFAAAKRYFNILPSDLSPAQSAMLAGMMRSPTNYDPIKNPEASQNRRDTVLQRMLDTDRLDQAGFDAAVASPLGVALTSTPSGCTASSYPLYCAYVRDELLSNAIFGATPEEREENLYRGGLTISTALDRSATDKAMSAASAAFSPANRVADGVAVIEPGTGYVSALAQSKPYGQGENETEIVYATRPAFQPGSTFKAITLATALEQGFNPRTLIEANTGYRSRVSDNPASGAFRNSSNANPGAIDAYEASKKSINVFYVKLIEQYGVLKTADMAARLGITSLPRSGPSAVSSKSASLTLGAYETSPLQMASAYAAFAANGVVCAPTGIVSALRTVSATPVAVPDPACHQAIDPSVARQVQDILQGGLQEGGTAEGRGINRPAFGKTGTTNSNAATWFVGSTPQYTTAVWVGDPRGGTRYPLNRVTAYGSYIGTLFGATVAARVWQDTMLPLHDNLPVLPLGQSVSSQPLNLTTLPNVSGQDPAAAASILLDSGFQVQIAPTTAEADPLVPANVVVSQDPPPGVFPQSGGTITLTLSAGSNLQVVLPTKDDGGIS